ncbi:MAG: DNA mismatch repair endonuclease MutL [Veillonellales bacterium]
MSDDRIHILDEHTANQIAAGEVVERPASVIKELVENSIDAKGHSVEIEIANGGINFIRVTDDGIGMSPTDTKLAVLRHATSKIRLAGDLVKIYSLGFRGEALPSIAAVAKLTITTRQQQQPLASYIEIQGGKIVDIREAGGSIGTTVTVTDLFFNTPARQKFLKTPGAESTQIHNVLGKLALSQPEIAFKLINNGKTVVATPGNGQLYDTLLSMYGHKIGSELLPIDYDRDSIAISGYVSKPSLLKSSRNWQTFIVNGRIINSRFIAKAIDNAYHSLLPKIGFPLAVLNIKVPLESIDVNVHPQKSEVKFSNEQIVFRAVYRAITEALTAPQSLSQLAATVEPSQRQYHPVHTDYESQQNYSPVQSVQLWQEGENPVSIETARRLMQQEEPILAGKGPAPVLANVESNVAFQPLGQVSDCYIVAQGEDGLYIIDQHAAHERILYDRLCGAAGRIPVQQLLMPAYFEFDAVEMSLIEENHAVFYDMGFTLEQVGPNSVRLVETPADVPSAEVEALLRQIMEIIQTAQQPSPEQLRHACLQMTACRAAIKAGDPLNMRQIQALLSELCNTDFPYTCPHGRPAIINISTAELAKMFKRT